MASDRIITTGFSGIWRNKKYWLHLGRQENPVIAAGDIVNAANESVSKSEKNLSTIQRRIVIYEANPNAYESLDDIKLP